MTNSENKIINSTVATGVKGTNMILHRQRGY